MAKQRDYKEEHKRRKESLANSEVISQNDHIVKVSKKGKDRISISIHKFVKSEYIKISDTLSNDIEAFMIERIEREIGKKIVFVP